MKGPDRLTWLRHMIERTRPWHRLGLSLSQAGQDLWVYGEVFNERQGGYFVDAGAHDGVRISNTYLLERRYGWNGICIEANPITFEQLRRRRRAICVNACLDAEARRVGFAPRGEFGSIVPPDAAAVPGGDVVMLQTRTLETVLREHAAPRAIDYLSIDVEGADERVLGRFPFDHYQFTCMTVERPPSSLRAVLDRHGYVLIKELPWLDCFYVHCDFMAHYEQNQMAFYAKAFVRFRWW